jgi:hypothetical protein
MTALLIVFLPKINLYYAAEKMMAKQNVYISDENLKDKGISFHIENASLLFEKLPLAQVEEIRLRPWILYNSIEVDTIVLNEGFADFLPSEIDTIEVKYWIFNPLYLKLSGQSKESLFYGEVDLLKRTLRIHLRLDVASEKQYKTMLGKLTPEEGGYRYEYKF